MEAPDPIQQYAEETGPMAGRKEIWQENYINVSEVQRKSKCYRQENTERGT